MKLEAKARLEITAAACPNFLKVFGLRFIQQIQKKLPDLTWASQFKQHPVNKSAWVGSFKTAKTPKTGRIIGAVLEAEGMEQSNGVWKEHTGSVLVKIELDLDRSSDVLINMKLYDLGRV